MRRSAPASILAAVLAVTFSANATAQLPDFVAPPGQLVLDTGRTVVQPTAGPPITVVGGVFRFRNVTIPAGSIVRGVGPNPMLWIVDNLNVDGELSVSGEDGEAVNTLNSANIPARGGRGGAAGGDGGAGSPQIAFRSFAGQSGNGPGNAPGMGGTGGLIADPTQGRGSGGGGGAFATTGDPYYPVLWSSGTRFQQQLGLGGQGCNGFSGSTTRTLPGGGPGGSPFVNQDDNDDFVGTAVDVFQRRFVRGELLRLVGGAGGGGGGDYATVPGPLPANWIVDPRGGGGGGGGGCLVVVALGSLTVNGSISANGGNGGGGEQAGSCNYGGGGGGGAGGLLVLASLGQITLQVRGETYANRDYDFVLSADGGVCTTGTFGTPVITSKYLRNGMPYPTNFGTTYDAAPLGGFGGLGVVELLVPPGNNSDGTNTLLDDNIVLLQNGQVLTGAAKQRFLAWRGFVGPNGVRLDDAGVPTNIGSSEGDIRPSPVLIPLL